MSTSALQISFDNRLYFLTGLFSDSNRNQTLFEMENSTEMKLSTHKKFFKDSFRPRTTSRHRLGIAEKRCKKKEQNLERCQSLNAALCNLESSLSEVMAHRLTSGQNLDTVNNQFSVSVNDVTELTQTCSLPNHFSSEIGKLFSHWDISMHTYVNSPVSGNRVRPGLPPLPPSSKMSARTHGNAECSGTKTKRSYILHRNCCHKNLNLQPLDVVFVLSSKCQVSSEWAKYIQNLFSKSANITKLCKGKPLMENHDVEAFSDYQSSSEVNLENLRCIEEKIAHAKLQIVILSRPLLDWIYNYPSLLIGNLFNIPSKVIGLLLGVKTEDLCLEHRSTLVTFDKWSSVLTISGEGSKHNSGDMITSNESHEESWDEKKESHVNIKPKIETFSLQLHTQAVQVLEHSNAAQDYKLTLRRTSPKIFQIWPQSVTVKHSASCILLLLSRTVKIPDDICEVIFHCSDEPVRKISALCKQINPTTLEVVVPKLILGRLSSRRCLVRLSVNGEPWCSSSNFIDIRVAEHRVAFVDEALAEMVRTCLPRNLFQNLTEDNFTEPDPEVPTLLHWAAKNGLPKMTKVLTSLPNANNAGAVLNQQSLTAADVALRNGHLEIDHLLRHCEIHNYEYPVLSTRDSLLSVKTNAPRRESSSDGHEVEELGSSYGLPDMDGFVFEGPTVNSIPETPKLHHDQACYDVPPKPVPVSPNHRGKDKSLHGRDSKAAGYVPMQPRCNSQPPQIMSSPNELSPDAAGKPDGQLSRPQSRSEVLTNFFCRNSPSDMILSSDKDLIDIKPTLPLSGFEPVVLPDTTRTRSTSPDTDSVVKVETSLSINKSTSSKDLSKESEPIKTPSGLSHFFKRSFVFAGGSHKKKKKNSGSGSKFDQKVDERCASSDVLEFSPRQRSQSSLAVLQCSSLSDDSITEKSSTRVIPQSPQRPERGTEVPLGSNYDIPRKLHPTVVDGSKHQNMVQIVGDSTPSPDANNRDYENVIIHNIQ